MTAMNIGTFAQKYKVQDQSEYHHRLWIDPIDGVHFCMQAVFADELVAFYPSLLII